MGLDPLEFSDCLTDSPIFRTKLHEHEKELERTSKSIKTLINDGKDLLSASKHLAKAQKQFSNSLMDFNFECIGQQQTDDERLISGALKEFGSLMSRIEDERERMLEKANEQFIKPLEHFRKQHIVQAKEGKKAFDKQTQKFCASLDRYLSLKTKVPDSQLQENDAQLELERRGFYEQSMKYVLQLQEVQERKKFEFVEILLVFMYSLLTFYHEGHETAADSKPYLATLQHTLQKTRNNFETTREQAESLMLKMLDCRGNLISSSYQNYAWPDLINQTAEKPQSLSLTSMVRPMDQTGSLRGTWTRQGYLYLMEKKALANSWTKYWCCYNKDTKKFYMLPFNQATGKMMPNGETVTLQSCTRRASDSIDRRFCIDLSVMEKTSVLTFQALSEEDRKLWMDVMDGKEPIYNKPHSTTEDSSLDEVGFNFIKRCLCAIENRGLDDQGLYRVVGVSSKVNKLITLGLDRKKADKLDLNDPTQYETKTITSAVKHYLRTLPEPLMTFKLHADFISAAKRESQNLRLLDIHTLVHKLPEANFEMLDLIIAHLRRVSRNADKNLMTVANLGVCFGPTLMRPEEETVAAIMDIKFCNIVIEILVEHYDMIFKQAPEDAELRTNLSKNQSQEQNANRRIKSMAPGPPVNHMSKPTHVTATAQSVPQSPRQYANISSGLPYSQQQQQPPPPNRGKYRPVDVYNPTTGSFETQTNNSISGSSESLNSNQSNHVNSSPALNQYDPSRRGYPVRGPGTGPVYSNINVSELGHKCPVEKIEFENTKLNANRLILSTSDVPTFGSIKKRTSNDHSTNVMSTSMQGTPTSGRTSVSMTGSVSGSLGGGSTNSNNSQSKRRNVRTLYHCEAENSSELSFEPNEIIKNVRPSKEPGWLEGSLNGKVGLIPENYVEFID
ncbi:rho GTPase-activating protein 10-like isoform X2 [Ruditapes philippinarum]|uniref:rho GTPase-activating protein 10-like isoform X2 n=1 Tax=Ruditapes philippinarum TaxID=129788 RepID=UPI00295BD86F|nr:rho GTPase-activating protein 10-like isoform X2 [Ruditapes philippinarum]